MNAVPPLERYPVPPRRFLPGDFRPLSWGEIEPLFRSLELRPLAGAAGLESWLHERGELDAVIGGEAARRAVAAACNTADAAAAARHLEYQTEVLPEVQRAADRLDRRYLTASSRRDLAAGSWRVYDRDVELQARLFRAENVGLEAELEELAVEFARICGARTVEFRGATVTLPALSRHQEDQDRGLREQAWRLDGQRRLADRAALDELFERMLARRVRISANAGFANYRDYAHLDHGRFDYQPDDCLALHRNVERHVLPLLQRLRAARLRRLGVPVLRPWDLAVDPDGLPSFQPFDGQRQQVRLVAGLLAGIDPAFAADLSWMEERGLLDLETRPAKQAGGFMETFDDLRWPFIFANSPPTQAGVETLVHECGHAVHCLLARRQEPAAYRHAPMEFCEVASMAMEAMALEHLAEVYPRDQARRAALDALEGVVAGLASIACVDAFQHWLYLHPEHDAAQRSRLWTELRQRFTPGVDWRGLEELRSAGWQSIPHLFESPFYYIEYAIAQIGALQLWRGYRRDRAAALRGYRAGLEMGGSRPLPELFAAAGLRFDPRGESLGELMDLVEGRWFALLGAAAG